RADYFLRLDQKKVSMNGETCIIPALWKNCMTLSGLCPHSFHEELSSHGNARYLAGILKAALLAIMAPIIGFGVTSHAYVLEGQSWPAGTVVVLQLSLGNPGRTLQDGNTSWNNAVAPVAEMWN